MADARSFTPALFSFLRDLAAHNDRDWFQANRDRWERDARQPALRFVRAIAPHLRRLSPHFHADPRPVGGSLFRIHRDTRFSKDKSPYKTWVAMQFRHEWAKDVHTPGYYVHLQPGQSFVGVGLWHPDGRTLERIRNAMVDDPAAWRRAVKGKRFVASFALAGESLKRAPRGFDVDHPLVDDLKRKDLVAVSDLSQRDVTAVGFAGALADRFRAGSSLVRYLCDVLEMPF